MDVEDLLNTPKIALPLQSVSVNLKRVPVSSASNASQTSTLTSVRSFINPLVTAAAPLFNLGTKLRFSPKIQQNENLHEVISQEMKILSHCARMQGYDDIQVEYSVRLMATFLKESLELQNGFAQKIPSSNESMQEQEWRSWSREELSQILDRCLYQPQRWRAFLELSYLCLSCGLLRHQALGPAQLAGLDQLIERIYNVILSLRGEFSKKLLIEKPKNIKPQQTATSKLPSIWVTLLLTGVVLLGIYLNYNNNLNQIAKPIMHLLASQ